MNKTPRQLEAGDVVCFSAGSSRSGPEGFRVLGRDDSGTWLSLVEILPELGGIIRGPKPPLIVSAYPATLGTFSFGVFCDTYLSPRVFSRALQLAAQREHPVVVLGQPLFVADALLAHVRDRLTLPPFLLFAVGGYPLPRSLEAVITSTCEALGARCQLLHCYGLAEAGPACLVGTNRNPVGQVLYKPRRGIGVAIGSHGALRLTLSGPEGEACGFETGDFAAQDGDGGYVVWNDPRRVDPEVLALLESWTMADWQRRTGHLNFADPTCFQLRSWCSPVCEEEMGFFAYARRFGGGSWLEKPKWSR